MSDDVTDAQRETEQEKIGHCRHIDGLTRGTMVEYDGWQWCVVTEIVDQEERTMVGFVLVDKLGDAVSKQLESAWGCWEHYDAIESYRDGEHEYWTDIDYLTNADVWAILGPLHPDARSDQPEATA